MTSTIEDGNMHPNLSANPADAQANFDRYCLTAGYDPAAQLGLRIIPNAPETRLAVFADEDPPLEHFGSVDCDRRLEADGVVMSRRFGAFVLSGDCYPVAIAGSEHMAVLHLGYKAINAGLVHQAIAALQDLGYAPADMAMDISPGIAKQQNIVILSEIRQLRENPGFWNQFIEVVPPIPGIGIERARVNPLTALLDQAVGSGIPMTSVWLDGRSTFTHPNLFSRRASRLFGKERGNHVYLSPFSFRQAPNDARQAYAKRQTTTAPKV